MIAPVDVVAVCTLIANIAATVALFRFASLRDRVAALEEKPTAPKIEPIPQSLFPVLEAYRLEHTALTKAKVWLEESIKLGPDKLSVEHTHAFMALLVACDHTQEVRDATRVG